MKTIDIEDTVTFHRPDTETTQRLTPPPRRPKLDETAEREIVTPRTLAVVDDQTGALPTIGGDPGPSWTPPKWVATPDYVGRHRRPVPLLVRVLAAVGINLARGAR